LFDPDLVPEYLKLLQQDIEATKLMLQDPQMVKECGGKQNIQDLLTE
jgi:hypothetical protein